MLDYPFDIVVLPRPDIPEVRSTTRSSTSTVRCWLIAGQRLTKLRQRLLRHRRKKRATSRGTRKGEETDDFHTVRTGETLWTLAQRFNTTIETLLKLNPGLDPNKLYVGQRIRVKGVVLLRLLWPRKACMSFRP